MRDFTPDLRDLERRRDEAAEYLNVADNRERFAVLEAEIAEPGLWDDQERAKKLNREYADIKDDLDIYDRLGEQIGDVEVLHELARDEGDESQEPDIETAIATIGEQLDQLELRSLFTGEHDGADCIVQINAKDGGVDAQDWAEMLFRMYLRWCETKGFTVEILDQQPGDEAGIKDASIAVRGPNAYGYLKAENGCIA